MSLGDILNLLPWCSWGFPPAASQTEGQIDSHPTNPFPCSLPPQTEGPQPGQFCAMRLPIQARDTCLLPPTGFQLSLPPPYLYTGPSSAPKASAWGSFPPPLDLYPFLTLRYFLVWFSGHHTCLSLWSREPLGFQLLPPSPLSPLPPGNLDPAVWKDSHMNCEGSEGRQDIGACPLLVHSFYRYLFIQHLLCARHCAWCW